MAAGQAMLTLSIVELNPELTFRVESTPIKQENSMYLPFGIESN